MSESIINQLKEYAMIAASDLEMDKTGGEFTEELQGAFQRAMEFSEMICPVCFVKDNQSTTLSVSDKSDSTEAYACGTCGFNEELEKGD